MGYMELYNNVLNLSIGWTNWYWANEQLKILNSYRKEALRDKKKIKNELHIDVELLYKEIDAFEECLKRQPTLTDLLEERYTLAAYEYAVCNRPIISFNSNRFITQEDADKFLARYKHDVFQSLISFYIYNQKAYPTLYSELKDKFIKFLAFCKSLKNAFPTANYVNPTPFAILVIKKAIKEKDDAFAKEILNSYEYTPSNDKEIEYLNKIRGKLLDKKLLN